MVLPDVNVLIYAFRRDSSHYDICRPWLNEVVLGSEPFGISPLALSAVVRITTNRRSYASPSTLDEAIGFGEDLLGQPHCRVVEPGRLHWQIFSRLCLETNTVADRVADAWYAALAIESGCEWITMDRDFGRFPGLRWRRPAP